MGDFRRAVLFTALVAVTVVGCGRGGGGATTPPTPTSSATTGPTPTSPPPSATSTPASPAWSATPTPSARPSLRPTQVPLAGRVLERIPTSARVVALTFDAGANADGVASILATLRSAHVPASFFLTGAFASGFPDTARRMAQAGRIGDHTVDHPHLVTLGDAAVRAEVLGAEATILQVTGQQPRPWFRFPYGEWNTRTLALVNQLGFVAVGWTVDSAGWKGTSGGVSAATVLARVKAALRPGAIVLMHVGSNPDDRSTLDADALPQVIAAIRGAGYGFVTLDAALSR